MKAALSVYLLLLLAGRLYAQSPAREMPAAVRQIIETVATNDEAEHTDIQALFEVYETLLDDPLDLNTATEADLQQLQLLTDFQIRSLLDYRATHGALYTLHELPLIHGFSEELAAQLRPFITVAAVADEKAVAFKDRFRYGKHQVIMRTAGVLEPQAGYASAGASSYLGGAWSYYTRYKYRYKNKLQWGITADNDAGEPFFAGRNRYGFDFYSAHVQMADWGVVKQAVLGDYHLQFGQGLVVWDGYSLRNTGDVSAVKKHARGILPCTSAEENTFRRGGAVTLQHGQWSLSAFASHKNIDATADSLSFQTLPLSGLHNTANTMAGKHSLPETAAGGNLSYRFQYLHIGATVLWHRYGKEYRREIKPYNRFELSASQNVNAGIDFYGVWRSISFFGEMAVSANGGLAGLWGALFEADATFHLALLYRCYGRRYQSRYAQSFGENSRPANEEGWYLGAQWVPRADLTLSAAADICTFPWMRYRAYAPSHGFDCRAQADYRPYEKLSMYLRVQQKMQEENTGADYSTGAIRLLQPVRRWQAHYEIAYELLPGLRLRDHIAGSLYRAEGKETGLLLYHDTKYKPPHCPVDLAVRFAVFDTDSWNTRFYTYEDDVLYAFSVPACAGKGARWYIKAHLRLTKHIDCWLRLAQSYYFHADTNGTGDTQINAPHRTALKLQVSAKW